MKTQNMTLSALLQVTQNNNNNEHTIRYKEVKTTRILYSQETEVKI